MRQLQAGEIAPLSKNNQGGVQAGSAFVLSTEETSHVTVPGRVPFQRRCLGTFLDAPLVNTFRGNSQHNFAQPDALDATRAPSLESIQSASGRLQLAERAKPS
jgi:hypothetical protein